MTWVVFFGETECNSGHFLKLEILRLYETQLAYNAWKHHCLIWGRTTQQDGPSSGNRVHGDITNGSGPRKQPTDLWTWFVGHVLGLRLVTPGASSWSSMDGNTVQQLDLLAWASIHHTSVLWKCHFSWVGLPTYAERKTLKGMLNCFMLINFCFPTGHVDPHTGDGSEVEAWGCACAYCFIVTAVSIESTPMKAIFAS